MQENRAEVRFSDPHVPVIRGRDGNDLECTTLSAKTLAVYDLVLLATNHDGFDYDTQQALVQNCVRERYEHETARSRPD